MRKWLLAFIALIFSVCLSRAVFAADHSSDTMILNWRTEKVWMEHGELCARGRFYNKRGDLTITKLDSLVMQITFTGTDGQIFQFKGSPKKMPMLKIPANGSKKVTLNFGPFAGKWKDWVTKEDYSFSYINGSRW